MRVDRRAVERVPDGERADEDAADVMAVIPAVPGVMRDEWQLGRVVAGRAVGSRITLEDDVAAQRD